MDKSENNYPNLLAERETAAIDTFLKEYDWLTADTVGNWLDPKEAYVRPKFTLSYNGVPFAPLGGIAFDLRLFLRCAFVVVQRHTKVN